MLTTFKLFFSSSTGWIMLALMAALSIGAYSYGHTNGYADGHTKGFAEGRVSRNEEVSHLQDNVAGLTQTVNDERKAQAEKIKAVQKAAADQAVETEKHLSLQIRARDQIIASYKVSVRPEIQQHCGLSIETVHAINALIQNVNEEPDETPAALPAPPDGSLTADPTDSQAVGHATDTVKELQ